MADAIRYSVQIKGGVKKWGLDWSDSMANICKPEAMNLLAKGYRYYINKYVPKETGALRRSSRAKYKVTGGKEGGNGTGSATIYWGTTKATAKYAHYQLVGDVYGPNRPLFKALGPNLSGLAGVHSGWVTHPDYWGEGNKFNTGRKMGKPFTYEYYGRTVHVKGYTTPNTGYDWIQRFKDDKGDTGETAINIMAGRFMYEIFCIHSKKEPLRGGRHVYNHWRQIANIRD